jgi:hypothetical protein
MGRAMSDSPVEPQANGPRPEDPAPPAQGRGGTRIWALFAVALLLGYVFWGGILWVIFHVYHAIVDRLAGY